ncbi:MAG: nickel-dependent lactate racemase [Spirochaetaceae bacterium]|nr:nickel-dependent lactate racemase [Spirochaetaceae bacterium]
MKAELNFGKSVQCVNIENEGNVTLLNPNVVPLPKETEIELVENALLNPIESPRLKDICTPGKKIAIVTSDITRPCPSYKMLPPLLKELALANVGFSDVTIVFALGSHRRHTEEEMRRLVGDDVFEKVSCIDSKGDFVHLGETSSGTPVDIFAPVANADIRICLGNIEYHYFAGYSGGAKAIMPGVSTREAIQANHSKMVLDDARAGLLDGNPLRQDIDEVANFCHIDFILNVVLDEHKKIVAAVAGHYIKAHRQGCKFLDSLYGVKIKEKAKIVIASSGGFPKDINLYQAQKALDNAKHAVADGGVIILCASCAEGFGEGVFEKRMQEVEKSEDWVTMIQQKFELGAHKAAAIGLVLKKAKIYAVTDLDDELIQRIFFKPFKSVQEAFDAALDEFGKDSSVIIMPFAGSTLPIAENA